MSDDLFEWAEKARLAAEAAAAERAAREAAEAAAAERAGREAANGAGPSARATGAAAAPAIPGVPAGARVVGVGELTRAIKERLESTFYDVWVEGEVSGCHERSGVLWFDLKDRDALVGAVIWRAAMRAMKAAPRDGDKVVCRGRLDVYPPKGEYRLVVVEVVPRGLGALLAARRALEEKLAAEGLLDPARRRALPFLPRRVGLVTSATGAAVRDFLRAAELRFPRPDVVIAPARVQGEGAARSVVVALARLLRVPGVDVVVVARGGGSVEDLWAFNDEALARAIAAFPVPVVSAVGHERDVTIADLVADLRVSTPSAAAVAVFPDHAALVRGLGEGQRRLRQAVQRRTSEGRSRIDLFHVKLGRAAHQRVVAARRRLDGLGARLGTHDPQRRLARLRAGLAEQGRRLAAQRGALTAARRTRLAGLGGRLRALSPLNVLDRGYAIVRTPEGGVVTDAAAAAAGDALQVRLRRGALDVRVTGRHEEGDESR
jgi:exodeoxyribonuclease VII large subunit